jgi:CheY-like chemotaxis protein
MPSEAGARVLLIDDEDGVREALRDILISCGNSVEIFRNGREGLRAFEQDHYDVVFTDLGMPGISGWQVAEAIKAKRPDVPVVLVTGWGIQIGQPDPDRGPVDVVLGKPFKVDDVLRALGQALNIRAEKSLK